MRTFATPTRSTALTSRRYTVRRPLGRAPSLERAEIRRILHGPRLQTNLTVGAPDDACEREADRVADAVMRMPEPGVVRHGLGQHTGQERLQRVCPECEEELQRQTLPEEEPEEEETVAAKSLPGATPEIDRGLKTRIQGLRGGGRPLPEAARSFFEPRFGHDFDAVRVHADPPSGEVARAVQARAFTVGRDIVFGAGQYQPESTEGRRLLAHELTHVLQQREGRVVRHSTGGAERLQAWSITGNRAVSDKGSDTLWGLAKSLTGRGRDWVCIQPISMKSPLASGQRYYLYVRKGDEFDISNLTTTTGETLRIFLFSSASESLNARLAMLFYPGSQQSGGDPDVDIETGAGGGATPIQNFLIFGHAHDDEMWGDAASFRPADFNPEEPKPSFAQASIGMFPRRCWFTRNAAARSVGCDSVTWGADFSRRYLRRGSSIVTTLRSVQPRCRGIFVDHSVTPPGCFLYNGVAFTDSPARTAPPVGGPYWSAADFHAGAFWQTLNGRL
jgi:hypothetical protein